MRNFKRLIDILTNFTSLMNKYRSGAKMLTSGDFGRFMFKDEKIHMDKPYKGFLKNKILFRVSYSLP